MPKRRYTDADKAEALAMLVANGGNAEKTARDTGIPRKTIYNWSKDNPPVPAKIGQEKKEALSDLFERVSRKYLDHSLEEGPLNKTSGKDAVLAAAVAADKMQLLRECGPRSDGPNYVVVMLPEKASGQRREVLEAVCEPANAGSGADPATAGTDQLPPKSV